jgi:predicted RecB family nuclease
MKITNEVLEGYLNCRTKGHLKLAGEVGTRSDYEAMTTAASQAARGAALAKIVSRFGEGNACWGIPVTAAVLKQGAPLLAHANLEDDSMSIRIDALKRAEGASKLGGHHYLPVLHVHGDKVGRLEKLLLAVLGLALAQVQGLRPATGLVARGPENLLGKALLDAGLYRKAEQVLDEVKRLWAGGEPPQLTLNKHCQVCEFRQRCRAAAEEKNDLSLLGGMSAKQIVALNAKGIFTVTQYSYTFRPRRKRRFAAKKHDHSLQALAIRENTVYVAKQPELPNNKAMLYLDVEGLPEEGSYYLLGLTIVEGESRRHLSFWANSEDEEASIWASFLAVVESIEDFVLLHYGSYEAKFLERMESRHGGDPGLIAKLKSQSLNVLSLIYSHVYFPVYANDLKSVAGCLGFRWSTPDASGLQSIFWRHAWQTTQDNSLKQTLLTYNHEDCEALGRVVDLLRSLSGDQGRQGYSTGLQVAGVESVGRQDRRFGKQKFALSGLDHITQCAYFDYQRDKITCRTSPGVRKSIRRKETRDRRAMRVDREVECGVLGVCPHCGSSSLGPHSPYQRVVIDLKPSRSGVKRWVTRYKVMRYRCRQCKRKSLPDDYRALPSNKHGWGLCSWAVYSSVSLRQTDEAVTEALENLFDLSLRRELIPVLRRRAAAIYQPTYESLLDALRKGKLVHADETRAKIKTSTEDVYVWVFADPQTAAYVYSPRRDGDTLRDTLSGFNGVLVSDFYAAYDSLKCPQQKCLIHLIRDFNDDLLKHPFDEELKQQATRFTAVLQPVVATIDRYGLKKYHLHKHKKEADGFLAMEAQSTYRSELAGHYQQRFLKYRDKLFTFLDHDGIPWNNNNAENAVKRFASRRKVIGAAFSEDGLRVYLQLLSLSQTLRYRGLSLWQFLISGEADLETFIAKCR